MSHKRSTLPSVIGEIRKAWDAGRAIVPIVGAGFSADSGFPVLRSIVQYLAQIYVYLDKGGPFPSLNGGQAQKLQSKLWERYRDKPWHFVEDFGWPDRFQLHQDLQRILKAEGKNKTATGLVAEKLTQLVEQIHPDRWWYYAQLEKELLPHLGQKGRLRSRQNWSVPWELMGDWRKLIQLATDYQRDYSDAMFLKLGEHKHPNLGHRYLAYISRLLNIRTIFTFNFDDLIERALQDENFRPRVFSMEEGANIPHVTLVSEVISVIKLHGSTHSLLVDERLDYPLTSYYKERFDRLVGKDPLLLVLGCSGGDRRLIDLVTHVLDSGKSSDGEKRVAWLHFESEPPTVLQSKDRLISCQTSNPALALVHAYSEIAGRNPSSKTGYIAHVDRVIRCGSLSEDELPLKPKGLSKDNPPQSPSESMISIISPLTIEEVKDENRNNRDTFSKSGASEALVDLGTFWRRRGYLVIQADLETVHTISGVVGSIIDQCRQYDTQLKPSVLPAESEDKSVSKYVLEKACSVLENALQRSRYLVLIDGLEAYLWPPLAHHGETTRSRKYARTRFENLCTLFQCLREKDLGESRIVIGLDQQLNRNQQDDDSSTQIGDCLEKLEANGIPYHVLPSKTGEAPPRFDEVLCDCATYPFKTLKDEQKSSSFGPETHAVCLLLLSACRHARPLVLIQHLLRPILTSQETINEYLADLEQHKLFGAEMLEGASLWLLRPVRNYLYDEDTKLLSTRRMGEILIEGKIEDLSRIICQLFLIYSVHYRFSRAYYVHNFDQSMDAFAFMAYTYHRVSALRYLIKLIAILDRAGEDEQWCQSIVAGLQLAGEFLLKAVGNDQSRFNECLIRFQVRRNSTLSALITAENVGDAGEVTGQIERLRSELIERHRSEADNLQRAWSRHKSTLRVQIPAEQLLHWSEQLINDDLPDRCYRVVVGYEDDGEPKFYPGDGKPVVDHAEAVLALLRGLKNLRVKLLIERSDYALAQKCRRLQLAEAVGMSPDDLSFDTFGALFKDLDDPNAEEPCKGKLLHIQWIIDMVFCEVKDKQRRGKDDDLTEELEVLDQVTIWLDQIAGTAEDLRSGVTIQEILNQLQERAHHLREYTWRELAPVHFDIQEARMRLEHLKAECQLQNISLFSKPFVGVVSQQIANHAELVLQSADRGLELNRSQEGRAPRPPRSVIIDPTTDGTLYQQYQSTFDYLRARGTWLKSLGDLHTKSEYLSKSFDDKITEHFQRAFRYFELSRGGLAGTNPLLIALNEMYYTETCLAMTRIQIYRASKHFDPSSSVTETLKLERFVELFKQAAAKLQSARGGLQRARDHLDRSRRNVIWWQYFFSLVAQYQSDCLMLLHTRFMLYWISFKSKKPELSRDDHDSIRRSFPRVYTRLRKGYNAIQNARDFQMHDQKPGDWLERALHEMSSTTASMLHCIHRFFEDQGGDGAGESPDAQAIVGVIQSVRESERLGVETGIPAYELNPASRIWQQQQEFLKNPSGDKLCNCLISMNLGRRGSLQSPGASRSRD